MKRIRYLLGRSVFIALFGVMSAAVLTSMATSKPSSSLPIVAYGEASLLLFDSGEVESSGEHKIMPEKNTLYTHEIDYGYEEAREELDEPQPYPAISLPNTIFTPPKSFSV